jgi:hypothetical protein
MACKNPLMVRPIKFTPFRLEPEEAPRLPFCQPAEHPLCDALNFRAKILMSTLPTRRLVSVMTAGKHLG